MGIVPEAAPLDWRSIAPVPLVLASASELCWFVIRVRCPSRPPLIDDRLTATPTLSSADGDLWLLGHGRGDQVRARCRFGTFRARREYRPPSCANGRKFSAR